MTRRIDTLRDLHRRRLDRQLDVITRMAPILEKPMKVVLRPSMWVLRVPLSLLLLVGGVLSFLPVFGLWMLPLGALLLAVDFTPIRPVVAGSVVRGRRKVSLWRRAWTAWRERREAKRAERQGQPTDNDPPRSADEPPNSGA